MLDFSQFLSCIGLIVQETTTLNATFTVTKTISTGYTTMTVAGCTPSGFPYKRCPAPFNDTINTTTPVDTSTPATSFGNFTADINETTRPSAAASVFNEEDGIPDERD